MHAECGMAELGGRGRTAGWGRGCCKGQAALGRSSKQVSVQPWAQDKATWVSLRAGLRVGTEILGGGRGAAMLVL